MKNVCPSCGHVNIAGIDRCELCLHSMMQRDLPTPRDDDRFQNAMMTAPVSEILSRKEVLVAEKTDTIEKLTSVLQKEHENYVLVYENKQLVGIISNRDLLRKVLGKFDDLSLVSAGMVMTPKPEFVYANDPLGYVVNKMAMGGFRHVPVLADDGTPLSVITINDVFQYLSRNLDDA